MAVAKGKESVAKAELEANYKPSPKARYEVRVAKAWDIKQTTYLSNMKSLLIMTRPSFFYL